MTFGEFFSSIGQGISKLGNLFLDMQMSDFFIGVIAIFATLVSLAVVFRIIRYFFETIGYAYDSLFEKIKNPWIRILINYWTWIILFILLIIVLLFIPQKPPWDGTYSESKFPGGNNTLKNIVNEELDMIYPIFENEDLFSYMMNDDAEETPINFAKISEEEYNNKINELIKKGVWEDLSWNLRMLGGENFGLFFLLTASPSQGTAHVSVFKAAILKPTLNMETAQLEIVSSERQAQTCLADKLYYKVIDDKLNAYLTCTSGEGGKYPFEGRRPDYLWFKLDLE